MDACTPNVSASYSQLTTRPVPGPCRADVHRAIAPVQDVVASTAEQSIVGRSAVQRVVAEQPLETVDATSSLDIVSSGSAEQEISLAVADDHVTQSLILRRPQCQ